MLYNLQLKYQKLLSLKPLYLNFNIIVFHRYCKESNSIEILFCSVREKVNIFRFYLQYFLLQQLYNYCFITNTNKYAETLFLLNKKVIKNFLSNVFIGLKSSENLKINLIGSELGTVFVQNIVCLLPEVLKNYKNIKEINFDLIDVHGIDTDTLIMHEHVFNNFIKEKNISINLVTCNFLPRVSFNKNSSLLGCVLSFDSCVNYTIFKKDFLIYRGFFKTNLQNLSFYKNTNSNYINKIYESKKIIIKKNFIYRFFYYLLMFTVLIKLTFLIYRKILQPSIFVISYNFYTGVFSLLLFIAIMVLNFYALYVICQYVYFYSLILYENTCAFCIKANRILSILKRFI